MKTNNLKWMTMAVLASCMMVSCSDDKNDPTPEPTPESLELKGDLTEDKTLESDKTYVLIDGFHVKPGVTLTIQPGVTIEAEGVEGNDPDYILIEKGAKIMATGSAEKPIVMTSKTQKAGAWGGLHICGDAKINVTGGSAKSEIGDASYGGTNDEDNSGVLKYIRVEYAGQKLDDKHEGNGFTFYGVGSGTEVDYCQAYRGTDDGFEFFGGSVNVKHVLSTSNSDDSFDWCEGWRGKGQFMIAYQESFEALNYECNRLIEADNDEDNNTLEPCSFPILANLTLVGTNYTDKETQEGIKLRRGTKVQLYNALITGKGTSLLVESNQTETSLKDEESIMNNVVLSNGFSSKESIFTQDLFLAATGNQVDATIELTGNFLGTIDGGTDVSSLDSKFFDSVSYKGAVAADNDWTKGWTK